MVTLISGLSLLANNHLYLGEAMAQVIKQDEAGYYYCVTNKSGCWKNWSYVDSDGHYTPDEPHILNNAEKIYSLLTYYGWKHKPICAVLGNMIAESVMNPAQGEINKKYLSIYGYGLCQWTPSTKYTNWARTNNHNIYLGSFQVRYLNDTGANQWIINPDYSYNMSWNDFISYDQPQRSVSWLASAFFRNYERGSALETYRQQSAEWYDSYFQGVTPQPPPPPDPSPYRRYEPDGMPLWMMLRHKWKMLNIEERRS